MAVTEEETSASSSSAANNTNSASSNSKSGLSSPSDGAYYLAKTFLRGSAIGHVVQGHFLSPSSLDVVFAKETSIELVIIDQDGVVRSICEQPVFGTIKDLAILPWKERFHAKDPKMNGKDILIVSSDSGKLSFLTFSNEMHRFSLLTHIQLSIPGNSRDYIGRMLAVDWNGCFIAACAYEIRLAMFSVSKNVGSDIIDERISYPSEIEGDTSNSRGISIICGTIWSMCFISKDFHQPSKGYNPILAILLNREGSLSNELFLLEWNTVDRTVHVLSQHVEAGPLSHHIIEVPHSFGYAFLFRVGDALLMDLRDAENPCCVDRLSLNFVHSAVEVQDFVEESCRANDVDEEGIFNVAASALLELSDINKGDDPMNIDNNTDHVRSISSYMCSWCWEPGNKGNPRMIFSVDTGDLFLIEISSDSSAIRVNLSESLYKISPCNALLWVKGGFLVAIEEMGDGMVLKLDGGNLQYRSPIQNVAPILDISVVECHDEKHDQVFACCGMAPKGSLRIIRNGITVEKLLKTAPIYQGITGIWTLKMKSSDPYHSFVVLSFVEETRVLSVGVSFTDVTDSVGFQPDICTLSCGTVGDGLLIQIHHNAIRLCLPTTIAHSAGIPSLAPVCTSWFPDNLNINLGAVGHNIIVVATTSPCFLLVLSVRFLSDYQYEMCQMQCVKLQNELSCISIPQKASGKDTLILQGNSVDGRLPCTLPVSGDIGNVFVVGTHKPSVEVLSYLPDKGIRVLAVGASSLTNTVGTTISGCVPQDVRLVFVDQLYVLSGLRNGMLLRFEWPSASTMSALELTYQSASPNYRDPLIATFNSGEKPGSGFPVYLQLIANRRIGITPTFLVPMSDSLDADVIILSDRPWLLQTARHSLSYTSISFQPSTHATPVCSLECPEGVLFVAENSLHLVEMVHSKRLNVQKFHLDGTPRKVLYHNGSKLLLILRTELSPGPHSSDICCVDPLSGSILSSFKFDPGEAGKCMELVKVGNEQVLIVGTSLSTGPAIMPNGEAESTRGRLIVLCLAPIQNSDGGSVTHCSKAGSSSQRSSPFREIVGYASEQLSGGSLCSSPDDNSCDSTKVEETGAWNFRLAYSTIWPGVVLAVCPYLSRYFLASASNAFYVCSFSNDNSQRVRRLAVGRTRFMIMTLTTCFTRIAVGDCRDGILFYSYHEEARKLEQLYCDPIQRLVADCLLLDIATAVVSDRKGSVALLSCLNNIEENASPESNLALCCSYYMGEIAMSIRKGSFSYKRPADDLVSGFDVPNKIVDLSNSSVMASTLLGSIIIFLPLSREEYQLLEAVQARLVVHPLTAPILGNDHNEFRRREAQAGVPKILDGDMLAQFLELTSMQQEAVLGLPLGSPNTIILNSKPGPPPITVNEVVRLLELVHYALN